MCESCRRRRGAGGRRAVAAGQPSVSNLKAVAKPKGHPMRIRGSTRAHPPCPRSLQTRAGAGLGYDGTLGAMRLGRSPGPPRQRPPNSENPPWLGHVPKYISAAEFRLNSPPPKLHDGSLW